MSSLLEFKGTRIKGRGVGGRAASYNLSCKYYFRGEVGRDTLHEFCFEIEDDAQITPGSDSNRLYLSTFLNINRINVTDDNTM